MNSIIRMPEGERIYLGAPSKSADKKIVDTLCQLVSSERRIIEAHYPQCYIPSVMSTPAQVLFIIVMQPADAEPVALALITKIDALKMLDLEVIVLPLIATDPIVCELNRIGCNIYG